MYNDSKLLAVADEEGYVSIVDTAAGLPSEMSDDWGPNKPRAQWLAHRNAVFDISWCNVRGWERDREAGGGGGGWQSAGPAVAS